MLFKRIATPKCTICSRHRFQGNHWPPNPNTPTHTCLWFYLNRRVSQKFETDPSNGSNNFGVFMWADWMQMGSYGFCGFTNVPSASELELVGYSSNHYPNTVTCLQATSPARQQPARPARKPAIQPNLEFKTKFGLNFDKKTNSSQIWIFIP